MDNLKTETQEIKKYLKKLKKFIEKDANLCLGKIRIVDKKRFDDIFCCIEANWPEDYKKYLNFINARKLKSPVIYNKLLQATKNKFFFSTSLYSIKYSDAIKAIDQLISSIDYDMNFIKDSQVNNIN